MRAGIHQPNFFPWMGYFDKMDQSEIFILLDNVQLTDSSMLQRNRVLNSNGIPAYLTVAFQKKGYLSKKIKEIELNDQVDWQKRQKDFLKGTYGKMPYWKEVWEQLEPIYEKKYTRLIEVNMDSILLIKNLFRIETKLRLQSEILYDEDRHKNDLILSLCKSVGADVYLSGTGARKYMDVQKFEEEGIAVEFQDFQVPSYTQQYSEEFVGGLSMLDLLFNCGISESIRLFQGRNAGKRDKG